jgi:hypothetical protein
VGDACAERGRLCVCNCATQWMARTICTGMEEDVVCNRIISPSMKDDAAVCTSRTPLLAARGMMQILYTTVTPQRPVQHGET